VQYRIFWRFSSEVPRSATGNGLNSYLHLARVLECSASEDKIADIIESLFLIDDQLKSEIQVPLPEARDVYYSVFNGLPLADQLSIQADAELQGAEAWRVMVSDDNPEVINQGLKQCMMLEKASSAYLYSIINDVRAME
jgi:hypothetical protein